MQDQQTGAIQRIPQEQWDALPYPEGEALTDGTRVKVVPHAVFVRQAQQKAKARRQRRTATLSRRQQRGAK